MGTCRLVRGSHEVSSFEKLVGLYPPKEFDSPFRSTVPLLSLWRDPGQCLVGFCQAIQISPPPHCVASFEYQVPPPKGLGKSSHTDLMLIWDSTVIAIEAKYTEPPYKTVRQWMRGGSPNKNLVLEGWLELISRAAKFELRPEDVLDLSYQLIHRSASACENEAVTRIVVYLIFDDGHGTLNYYLDQLKSIKSLLGQTDGLKFALVRAPFRPKPAYIDLLKKWKQGSRKLRTAVVDGLLAGTLMEFENFQTIWTG